MRVFAKSVHASRTGRKRRGLAFAGAAVAIATAAAAALPGGSAQAAVPWHESPLTMLLDGLHVTLPCGIALPGQAACTAVVDDDAHPNATAAGPTGITPAQLHAAYALPSAPVGGGAPIVAVVDAYDDPNLEADLAHYRTQYGLPACTVAAGCLKKVNETGGTTLPTADAGWAEEESLDVDAISAVCSACRILMVEANSTSIADLGTAVNTAATFGPAAISNSYGGAESSSVTTASGQYYNHPGIAVTASAGDSGYGVEFPASSQYVTAVGGTTLKTSTAARGWTESVWGSYIGSGTGSGCSAYIAKPTWQTSGIASCKKRSVADVSADADPSTGLGIYDTYGGQTGWVQVGGTSLASPIIASVYALAGNTGPGKTAVTGGNLAYTHAANLNDVTSGTNGLCFFVTSTSCAAAKGYDGPTGMGTPNGVGAF